MKTILWLDDEEKLINASIELFRKNGFEIVKATNTSRALTILREQELDGVLLDVRLRGGESGLEFLQEIHQRYPTLKVVICTGYPDYLDHVLAQSFGATFYFEKIPKLIPIEPRKLRKFFLALHDLFATELPRKQSNTNSNPERTVSIFCSYSHRDAKLREKLEEHLASLKQSGLVSVWHDRKIVPGQEWAGVIADQLNTADIILLLISASFMSSDYSTGVEVKRAMERHEARESVVIPVVLRPVEWQDSIFSKLQGLPTNLRPVTRWPDRDDAFVNIAQGIHSTIKDISRTAPRSGVRRTAKK